MFTTRIWGSGAARLSERTLDIMPAGTQNQNQNQNQNAVWWLFRSLWITFTFCGLSAHGHMGEGCGHTKLGPESGTLASAGYPGTYPQDVSCEWTLRVPQGRTLVLFFGDFNIEESRNCSNGSLMITPSNGPLGVPRCGYLQPSEMNFSLSTNEAKVTFRSGRHRSGRGFLLSYATDQNPDVLSCSTRGSHLPSNQLSVYCPAGCKDVPGEVIGSFEEAYRENSVVCKSAVHGGVVSDALGGHVAATREKGLRYYPSSFANGIQSEAGSLSDQKLLFRKECNDTLTSSLVGGGQRERANADGPFQTWTLDQEGRDPLVKLDLGVKRTVTGVITTGSVRFSIESYTLNFSRDGKTWKAYKGAESKEVKTFEANADGQERVLNSLFPAGVGRYVHLKPITSGKTGSAQIQLLGCPFVKPGSRTSSTTDDSTDAPVSTANTVRTQYSTADADESDLAKDSFKTYSTDVPKVNALTTQHSTVPNRVTVLVTDPSSGQPVGLVVGVVLGLVVCGGFLLAGLWWRRRMKKAQMKYSAAGGPDEYQNLQGKRQVYAQPAAAVRGPPQTQGSTFRPGPNPDHAPAFSLGRYHTTGTSTAGPEPAVQEGPEYAEPFPSEPEYATPFSEPLPEPARTARGPGKDKKRSLALPPPPPPPPQPPACGGSSVPGDAHYDCPSHRVLSNGYCTPSHQGPGPRPASVVYSEPEPAYSLLQMAHTYEELL